MATHTAAAIITIIIIIIMIIMDIHTMSLLRSNIPDKRMRIFTTTTIIIIMNMTITTTIITMNIQYITKEPPQLN